MEETREYCHTFIRHRITGRDKATVMTKSRLKLSGTSNPLLDTFKRKAMKIHATI